MFHSLHTGHIGTLGSCTGHNSGNLPWSKAGDLHFSLLHQSLTLWAEPPLERLLPTEEEEAALTLHFSSSSHEEAIIPPPPTTVDDFRHFQYLFCRIADYLQIPLEEIKDEKHKMLDILHTSSSSKIALLINEALNSAQMLWQTPSVHSLDLKMRRQKILWSGEGCRISVLAPQILS